MMSAAAQWQAELLTWAIPSHILDAAPENPWVHPPALFRVADPAAQASVVTPSLTAAREALQTSGSVLDVGCGGGGSSIGLAELATQLIGVDEQPAMLVNFSAACDEVGVPHQTFACKWPSNAEDVPNADVVVCHHVVYNVGDIEPFLRALTSHAQRRVVVELPMTHPTSSFNALWKHFWNLDRPTQPTAETFVSVVESLGVKPHTKVFARVPRKQNEDAAEFVAFVRRRLCLAESRDAEVALALQTIGAPKPTISEIMTVWWDVAN